MLWFYDFTWFPMILWWFLHIVVCTKISYQSFSILSNISKDAEFQGLSESVFIFLGWHDSTRLEAKYWFSIIDPPPIVKGRSVTKSQFLNYWNRWFCREFFSASFETLLDSKAMSKDWENLKILPKCEKIPFSGFLKIFMVYPKNWRLVTLGIFLLVHQKNLIFWI